MSLLRPFDVRLRGRVVFGVGAIAQLGGVVAELGVKRVLVVTDAGLIAAGIVDRARAALLGAGLDVIVFDMVREEPAEREIDRAAEFARDAKPDALVAVGGGSSIDTAKGINFLVGGGGRMRDYRGPATARGALMPLVAVPTTAGTGSEMQSYALIAEDDTHRKMACGDPRAVPRAVILDPELTVSMPRRVTAAAGVDALVHGLECAVTKTRSAASLLFAHEAFRLVVHHLERVLGSPGDVQARGAMLLGACWAGQAIEASMLGAAHAAANPLSAQHGVVHGHAVGLLAPHVIWRNAEDLGVRVAYRALARAADLPQQPGALADRVAALIAAAGLPTTMAAAGIESPDVAALAADAATQWTGKHNPVPMDAAAFEALYRDAR